MTYLQTKDSFKKYQHVQSVLKQGILKPDKPLVSIVITTYKRPETLKVALESALQQQNFADYEVIIVDNEIDDNTKTEKLLQGYLETRLLYYKNQENLGMVGNWNRAIELARGEWLTILHDDDMLFPDFLEKMFKVIKNNNSIAMLVSNVVAGNEIDSVRKRNFSGYKKNKLARYVLGNISPFPGVLFKKDNAINLGGFNANFYPCMDYVFWINYHIRYGSYSLYDKLAFYRLCETNASKEEYLNIIKTSYEIKSEILALVTKNKIVRQILLAIGMKNIINAYSIYDNNNNFDYLEMRYVSSNNIFINFVNKIITKILIYKL